MSAISHAFQTNKSCHIFRTLVFLIPEGWQSQSSCSSKAHVWLEWELHMSEVRVLQPDLPSLQTSSLPLGQLSAAASLGRYVWRTPPQLLLFPLKLPSLAQMTSSNALLLYLPDDSLFLTRPALPSSLSCTLTSLRLEPAEPSRGMGARTGRGASREKGHLPPRCLRVV